MKAAAFAMRDMSEPRVISRATPKSLAMGTGLAITILPMMEQHALAMRRGPVTKAALS
jgi:hypothetical protein